MVRGLLVLVGKRKIVLLIWSSEKTWSKVWENSKWRVRSKLRSETVGVKPYRYWGLPVYRCRWRVEHPHLPTDRRRI
jgi:hypothetical protein